MIDQFIKRFSNELECCDRKTKEGRKQIKAIKAAFHQEAKKLAVENILNWDASKNDARIKVLEEDWQQLSEVPEKWVAKECIELEIFLLNEFPANAPLLFQHALLFNFNQPLKETWTEVNGDLKPETTEKIAEVLKSKLPSWLVSWFDVDHQSNQVTANLLAACKETFNSSQENRIDFAGKVFEEIRVTLSGKAKVVADSPRWERW